MSNNLNLNDNQEKLQAEAQKVLDELDLIPLLSKVGTPSIIGSMALQVMTRKDIDIEIVAREPDRKQIIQIAQSLIEKPLPRIDFNVIDNTQKLSKNLPTGLYLGLKYAGKDKLIEKYKNNPNVWQIDCWFVKDAEGMKQTEEIKRKMTPQKKKVILEIKSALTLSPDYKVKFSGFDIYKAVIDKGVTSAEEFLDQIDHQ